MSADHPAASDGARRLRTANTLLIVVVVILLAQMAWQQIQIGRSRDAAAQSEHALSSAVGRLAAERLKTVGREELTSTMRWLDDFYRSSEGLQRPTGLWLSDRLDSEAIAVWIFDVYLQARMSGKSDAEARELVMGQIKSTEEWRRKHPAT